MEVLQVPDDCKEMCHRMLSMRIMMEQYLDYVKSNVGEFCWFATRKSNHEFSACAGCVVEF